MKPLWSSETVSLTLRSPLLVYPLGSGTRKIPATIVPSQQLYVKVVKTSPSPLVVIANRERLPIVPYALWSAGGGSGGTITAVLPGAGLTGGGTGGDVTLDVDGTVVQQRVTGTCESGSSIRAIYADGTVVCEPDDAGGVGTVTQIDTGAGLSGGPVTGNGTIAIDTAVVPQLGAANTFTGAQRVHTGGPASVGLAVQGAPGQTANLQEWRSAGGETLAALGPAGSVQAAGFSGSGTGLTGVNAATLGGQAPSSFAGAAHTHDDAYLSTSGGTVTGTLAVAQSGKQNAVESSVTGDGSAGVFTIDNQESAAPALLASTRGKGHAAEFDGGVVATGSIEAAHLIGSGGVTASSYAYSSPQCGAVNLGALDFQPTVTGAATIVRLYDEFGTTATGGNAKIGAAVHPPNGATPTEFSCWFQTTSSGNPQAAIYGNLWRIPLGGGSMFPGPQVLATVSLTGAVPAPSPVKVSTTSIAGGDFVTYDAVTGGAMYVVEIYFPDFSYPTFKATGCSVRWCANRVLQ